MVSRLIWKIIYLIGIQNLYEFREHQLRHATTPLRRLKPLLPGGSLPNIPFLMTLFEQQEIWAKDFALDFSLVNKKKASLRMECLVVSHAVFNILFKLRLLIFQVAITILGLICWNYYDTRRWTQTVKKDDPSLPVNQNWMSHQLVINGKKKNVGV